MTALLTEQTKVITGNAAAAYGTLLCRPDVVAAYPITPQSELIEQLAKFHADGILDTEYVTVEGENSAQNVVCGASMAGARAFTATSSYGLVYMYDTMLNTSGYRAPVVMVVVNREPPGIHAVCSGQQDMISVRDSGWVQLVVENCQEILDMTIQSFRLAEDYDIQLPVMLNYDGYYLSFLAEAVKIPAISQVDDFLRVLQSQRVPGLVDDRGPGVVPHHRVVVIGVAEPGVAAGRIGARVVRPGSAWHARLGVAQVGMLG